MAQNFNAEYAEVLRPLRKNFAGLALKFFGFLSRKASRPQSFTRRFPLIPQILNLYPVTYESNAMRFPSATSIAALNTKPSVLRGKFLAISSKVICSEVGGIPSRGLCFKTFTCLFSRNYLWNYIKFACNFMNFPDKKLI
jgi:hypothetical protein